MTNKCTPIFMMCLIHNVVTQFIKYLHEHKTSAIRYLANRLITYPLNNDDKNDEQKTIQHIIRNNGYNPIQLDNKTTTINTKTQSQHEYQTQKTKFTYVGPQTKYITKLFKITYKTINTIQYLLTQTSTSTSDKVDNCGIY